jgi:hypothetical protein
MYIIMTTPKRNPSKHLPASGTNRHCHPGISTPQVREERTLTWALSPIPAATESSMWGYGSTRCIPKSLDWWEISQETPAFHGENPW